MLNLFNDVPSDLMIRDAGLSGCGTYRYWLSRRWQPVEPTCCFVMLNPSTADASIDDPTIRRCIGFAKSWGYGGLFVANLFAFRATDPKNLPRTTPRDEVEKNNHAITMTASGGLVIAAWGCHPSIATRDREVMTILRGGIGCEVKCLGVTKDGYPRHPLYVRADAPLIPYGGRKAGAA